MKGHLIEDRWLRIPLGQIYRQLSRLNRSDWKDKSIGVGHYLFGGEYAYPYSLPPNIIEYLANRLNEGTDMTWYKKYNEQAMLYFDKHGIALNQALVYWEAVGDTSLPRPKIKPVETPGEPLQYGLKDGDEYIAIIGLFHLTGSENNFNHNLFIDLIDEAGRRIYNHVPPLDLYYGWEGMTRDEERTTRPVRIDKPDIEPGANIGTTWNQVLYGFHINNIACDRFSGIHIRYGDLGPDGEPDPGNKRGHHSHYIVLQKRIFRSISEPPPLPPPSPDPDPPVDPEPPIQVGDIRVRVNVAWVNSLPKDEQGNVTFFVSMSE